ncbi:Citrate synthase (si) [Serinicoccus hydrothermalis]|uniref:citrate synthase (unknown stereospecificity) n=1 Tax=Serinicoccus hydrothermalis TaxID=1758689 RepID=A0A1B1NDE1_9MICO|nr:citrate synthase [Serinicoccus hydrothermalis]ANS79457.1 Citrate synthase (si) [Serinicoccus hydrothermalis]
MSGGAELLTTAQTADYLGVKVQTLYAYVSRGVLAPVRREAGTGSLFAVEDVRALAGRPGRSGHRGGRDRTRATSDDVRTRITEVGPGSLAYRGHDVRGLAGTWTFEQVRDLLTEHTVVNGRGPGSEQAVAAVTAALPAGTPVLDRFKHAVLVAGGSDVGRYDRTPESFAAAGERAAAAMVGSLTGSAADGPLAVELGAYLDLPTDLLDTALVLLADHDLAVSTTAVRVAVSAGSDAYSALLAGLAAADSPLHVRAVLRAVDWLRAAILDPRLALDAALTDGPPPGFGHVVYTEQDPRAQVLLERLLPAADPAVCDAVALLEAELLERRGWVLTVDAALALLTLQHDLPRDAGAVIFACARTAGWTAHAIEELAEPGMRFRLRGIYTGPRRP